MADRTKTTVYLDSDEYRKLKEIAVDEGSSPAELIRDAISTYTSTHYRVRAPRSIGAGNSGLGSLSETDEEWLRGFGSES